MNEHNPVVVVIDDDPSVRESLAQLVRSMAMTVETFASAQQFLTRGCRDGPGCLVLDVNLPGLSGLDLQQELAKINALIPTIFISGQADIPIAVRAMKGGAVEFLTKPCRDEDLLNAIKQAIQRSREQEQRRQAHETMPSGGECRRDIGVSEIVGHSEVMRRVLQAVDTVAPTDSTVLVAGETGTGKELIARAIHHLSPRRSRSFVKLNCAAIPMGRCSKASCSDTREALSPARWSAVSVDSSSRVVARSFSMRSEISHWSSNPNCCVSSRSKSSSDWAARRQFG